MGCNAPLTAYRAPGGAITFDQKAGYYDRPLKLSCGQCRGCRLRRTRDWAIRAIHESQLHPRNCFITLTYSPEALPEDQGLNVKHWQDFAKRLRHTLGPFRFLHCGEYGERSLRPHYHACIFGLNFKEDRQPLGNPSGHPLFTSQTLTDTWRHGFVSIGELTFDSAAYVASYVFKKANGPTLEARSERLDPETGEIWKVKPEYATMSRRPGLGQKWFDKYKSDLYPGDFAIAKGQKFRPPKYYDRLLEKTDPTLWSEIQARRKTHVRSNPLELTAPRQEVREEILKRKHRQRALDSPL